MTSVPKLAILQPVGHPAPSPAPRPCSPGEAASRVHLCGHDLPAKAPSPDVKLGVRELQTQTNKSAPDHKRSRSQGGQG